MGSANGDTVNFHQHLPANKVTLAKCQLLVLSELRATRYFDANVCTDCHFRRM